MLLRNLQRFRLVTFDITDTLLRFRRAPAVQYAKTAAKLGVQNIDQSRLEICFKQEFKHMATLHPNFGCYTPNFTWLDWWNDLVHNIFLCVDPTIDKEKLKELSNELLRIYRTNECWQHVSGAQELVQSVRKANKKVGVISNFDPSLVEVLKEMNIYDKFDFILTSYEAGHQKPDKSIFDQALDMYKFKPHEALHIGNMYNIDYLGARNAGWSSLLVTRDELDLKNVPPTQGYTSIVNLLTALDNKEIRW
ncbi:hypothetical protein DOY81_005347 [Sarcophaga bullata]|nr:hypothetical protein DOY81_005347 [Sarcophaga bullata]